MRAHLASNLLEDIGLIVAQEHAAYHRQNPEQLELIHQALAYLVRGPDMSLRFDVGRTVSGRHESVIVQRGLTPRLEPRRTWVAPGQEHVRAELVEDPAAWYNELVRDLVIDV
ncbi:hypothetical protein AAVH_18908 [Aphelenchoides avenae]|nr:hypothetical protein AAVH_18908 [Aphelenchus avenae]